MIVPPIIPLIIFCVAFSLFVILLGGCAIIAHRNRRIMRSRAQKS